MRGRTKLLAGALVIVTLLPVACAGEDDTSDSAQPAPGVSSTSSPTGSSETPEPDDAADIARSVTVANFLFQPKTIRVSSGDTIELQNTNPQTPHTFTVTGEDIDVQLAPQTTETVVIELDRGTYPFICQFHESQGMTGTLEVS